MDVLDVEFLEHLLAAGRLLALGHIGTEATDKLLEFLTLLLGLGLLVLCLAEGKLRTLVPETIVAGKDVHLAEVDIHGVGANRIKEVTIVAHHQYGVLEIAQILLEPGHGLHVEVVGGLVEKKVVGITKKCLGQHDTHFLLTAEFAHQQIVLVLLDAQSAE